MWKTQIKMADINPAKSTLALEQISKTQLNAVRERSTLH